MSGFRRITFIGVGMIGATLARASRRAEPRIQIRGYDPNPPPTSVETGVDQWAGSAAKACHDAELVVLATPVGSILDLLPEVADACSPEAIVTDTGSTKSAVCQKAEQLFHRQDGPYFIGGHPMAGRERPGAQASDPDLLVDAPYVLCALPGIPDVKLQAVERWVRSLGARPHWIEPKEHDKIASTVSHLPQLMVIALASMLDEVAAGDQRVTDLAGSALHDLLRIASSPYPLWQDICRTNVPPIKGALETLASRLHELARDLESGEALEHWFESARHFREQKLRVRS